MSWLQLRAVDESFKVGLHEAGIGIFGHVARKGHALVCFVFDRSVLTTGLNASFILRLKGRGDPWRKALCVLSEVLLVQSQG